MTWPTATLESIYVLYPNKQDKKTTLRRIGEALDRIVGGEIDSKPRTQEEAVLFLREAVNKSCTEYAGRDKHFIPHSTTWFNKKYYLRPPATPQELPEDLENCIVILAHYPTIMVGESAIRANVKAFLPALNAVQASLKVLPYSHLLQRVKLYAECVEEWPKEDRRYVPNAARFFGECRYNQSEQQWRRNSTPAFDDERRQVNRILNA